LYRDFTLTKNMKCAALLLLLLGTAAGGGGGSSSTGGGHTAAAGPGCAAPAAPAFALADAGRWRRWFFEAYAAFARRSESAAAAAAGGAAPARPAPVGIALPSAGGLADLPIALVNLPFRRDRREKSLALLRELGLHRVHVPELVLAEQLDLPALIAEGVVTGHMLDKVRAAARRDAFSIARGR